MTEPLFSLTEPASGETPVIVEVPHAGLLVPPPYLALLAAPARSLGRDADLYVDELYAEAPSVGATLLVARTSRYVVDLNRAETDWDEHAVACDPPPGARGAAPRMPRGLVWRLTADGEPALTRPLTREELDARIATIHRPYHAALQRAIDAKKKRFGLAVVLAGHSMPSHARTVDGARGGPRADVVPGSQGRTTAAARFIDAVDERARAAGLGVRHDDPYRGGFTTRHYGRPLDDVHVVQVELARRLYMDETSLERTTNFDTVKAFCRDLVAELGQRALR